MTKQEEVRKENLVTIREDEETIYAISEATQKVLLENYGLRFRSDSKVLPTIIYSFILATIGRLNRQKEVGQTVSLNMANLFTVGIHWAEEEDSEKEGNFVPFVSAGPDLYRIVEDTLAGKITDAVMDERTHLLLIEENQEDIQKICDNTSEILKTHYSVDVVTENAVLPTLVHAFVTTMMRVLTDNRTKEGNGVIMLNLLQMINIGVKWESDSEEFVPFTSPGRSMKLHVKDDNLTEE